MKFLPKNWILIPLGDCCQIISGSTPKRNKPEYWGGDIPWVTPKDLGKLKTPVLKDAPEKITEAGYKSCSTTLLPQGSILFSSRAPIGYVAIAGRPMCTNQGFKSLVPNEYVHSPYLYWCMRKYASDIEALGSGTTFKEVSKGIVERFIIPLPPLEEQRRIAAILDKADGVRRKRKEAIRLTEELLKSTFLEMFGDPVTNPKGWEVRELGDCVKDIESGWSPKCDTRQAEPEEWGVLKLGAVTYGHFNPDENKAMLPDDVPRQELEIKTGDLLVTRKNTYELVGASAFVQMTRPKLMLPDLIFRLRLIDGIDPVYVWQTLSQKTMRLKLSGLAGGTAGSMPNISKARLRTLPFPVPPQLLQLKYREIFNQFWLKKEHQKESEEISENLFNSLLQKAFRGEL
jgi:type I restriction enzyme S subunit